jgi:hypothetical protein
MTSLAIACYEGHMTVVKRLLTDVTSPCDVNMVTGMRRNTALHEVIWYTQSTPLHDHVSEVIQQQLLMWCTSVMLTCKTDMEGLQCITLV